MGQDNYMQRTIETLSRFPTVAEVRPSLVLNHGGQDPVSDWLLVKALLALSEAYRVIFSCRRQAKEGFARLLINPSEQKDF